MDLIIAANLDWLWDGEDGLMDSKDLERSRERVIGTMRDLDLCVERLCRFALGFHCRERRYSISTSLRNSMATY